MKIVTVLGARPQFIKASVVSQALRSAGRLTEVVVHTGQHFDHNMSDVFFEDLGMRRPAYQLGIHGGSHGEMTGRMLTQVERVLLDERPAAVLVYGDTNSTLAGALAACKLRIPVAHVEAGLRSFNMAMPEEINRLLTDRVARWLFTPTMAAADHLAREGVPAHQIIPVGDVMYDVSLHHGARVDARGRTLEQLDLRPKGYVLATIHRAENTDNSARLGAVVEALQLVSAKWPVVWPIHPRTREVLRAQGQLPESTPALRLIDPVGYLDMVQLEKYAAIIATDSGGVQKEAFFYRVPCVTFRDETEWVELVEAGWNRLAPPGNAQRIYQCVAQAHGSRGRDIEPYGSGDSSQRIERRLGDDLGA